MGEANIVSNTFIIEHLVIHSGGDARDVEPAVDVASLVAAATPGGPPSTAMAGAGE